MEPSSIKQRMPLNSNNLLSVIFIVIIIIILDYNLASTDLLRPHWDKYFLRLAELVATRANCMKRMVGAVIVNDFRIVSTGYNGTPFLTTNCNQGGCKRCNSNTA